MPERTNIGINMNLEQLGENCVELIKRASWFPYASGNLRNTATSGNMITKDTYVITFSGVLAPYVEALEEGSRPHDIPCAFGREFPFGIGGRFDGKFHPGSKSHVGFIKDKSVNAIIKYICSKYRGSVE